MKTGFAIYNKLNACGKSYEVHDENHCRIHFTNAKGAFVLVAEENGAYTCARKKDAWSKWTKWSVGVSFEEAVNYVIKNL